MFNLPTNFYYLYQSQKEIEVVYDQEGLAYDTYPSRSVGLTFYNAELKNLEVSLEVRQFDSEIDTSLDLSVCPDYFVDDLISEASYRVSYLPGSSAYAVERLRLKIASEELLFQNDGFLPTYTSQRAALCSETAVSVDENLYTEDLEIVSTTAVSRARADFKNNKLVFSYIPSGQTLLSFKDVRTEGLDLVTLLPDPKSGFVPAQNEYTRVSTLDDLTQALIYGLAAESPSLLVNLLKTVVTVARVNKTIGREGTSFGVLEENFPGLPTRFDRISLQALSEGRDLDINLRLGLAVIYAIRYLQDRNPSDFISLEGNYGLLSDQVAEVLSSIAELGLQLSDFVDAFPYRRLDELGQPQLDQTAQSAFLTNIYLTEFLAHRYNRHWHEAAGRLYLALSKLPADVTSTAYSGFLDSEKTSELAFLRLLWARTHNNTEELALLERLDRVYRLEDNSPYLFWEALLRPRSDEAPGYIDPQVGYRNQPSNADYLEYEVVNNPQPSGYLDPVIYEIQDETEDENYNDYEVSFQSYSGSSTFEDFESFAEFITNPTYVDYDALDLDLNSLDSLFSYLESELLTSNYRLRLGQGFNLKADEAELFVNYAKAWITYSWPNGYLWQQEAALENQSSVLGSLLTAAADASFESALYLIYSTEGTASILKAQGEYLNLWAEQLLPRRELTSDRYVRSQLINYLNRKRVTEEALRKALDFWGLRPVIPDGNLKIVPLETSNSEVFLDEDLTTDEYSTSQEVVPLRYRFFRKWDRPIVFEYFPDPSYPETFQRVIFDPQKPDPDLFFYLIYQPRYLDSVGPEALASESVNSQYLVKRPTAGFTRYIDCSSIEPLNVEDVTVDSFYLVDPLTNYTGQFKVTAVGNVNNFSDYLSTVVPAGIRYSVEKITAIKV